MFYGEVAKLKGPGPSGCNVMNIIINISGSPLSNVGTELLLYIFVEDLRKDSTLDEYNTTLAVSQTLAARI